MLLAYAELLNPEELKHLRCFCGVIQDRGLHYLQWSLTADEGELDQLVVRN